MGKIHVVINGRKVTGDEGETILQVARRSGFDIPTLCHRDELKPSGVCRICVVEVEGSLAGRWDRSTGISDAGITGIPSTVSPV